MVFLQLSLSRVISHNTKKFHEELQAATVLVTMAAGKNFCPLHLQQKSPFGDLCAGQEASCMVFII